MNQRLEVEVRPIAYVLMPDGPVAEWCTEAEADKFGVYLQQEDGTFRWVEDHDTKNQALVRALVHAAKNGAQVVYRTEEGDVHVGIERTPEV